MVVGVNGGEFLALSAEGVDEIGDEVFLSGAGFEGFFFVSDDDFVVGDFDDFFAGDEELGVDEAFEDGASDDDLLDEEAVGENSKVDDLTEFGVFSGLYFEGEKVELET